MVIIHKLEPTRSRIILLLLLSLSMILLLSAGAQADTSVIIFSKTTSLVSDLRYAVTGTSAVTHDIFDLDGIGSSYNLYINDNPTAAGSYVVDNYNHISFTTASGGTFHLAKGSLVHDIYITTAPYGSPNPVNSGGGVDCSVAATDSFGHSLSYQWTCSASSFSNVSSQNPTWYAPINTSGVSQQYSISVTITCSDGLWTGGSFLQTVRANQVPIVEAGANQTANASSVVALDGCSSYDPDQSPSLLTYQWQQIGGVNTVTLVGGSTCNPTFVAPGTSDTLDFRLTVGDGAASASDTVRISVQAAPSDNLAITSPAAGSPNPVASGGDAQCSVSASDSLGHSLTYMWSATAGSFSNQSIRNPIWHSPTNTSGATRQYTLSVSVRCAGGESASSSFSQSVQSAAPSDLLTITSPAAGSPNPVASGGDAQCSVSASDSLGHSLTYLWSATAGSFSSLSSRNPVWHAPANNSGSTQPFVLSVTVSCAGGQSASSSFSQSVQSSPNLQPVADAGADQLVKGSALVTLDGCNSSDPDDGPSALTYSWVQTGGSIITLARANACNPTFSSPASNDTLQFTLTVNDGQASARDTVTVTVDAEAPALMLEDLAPYPNQGLDGNFSAVPETCIRARVVDNLKLDIASATAENAIAAYSIYSDGSRVEIVGETLHIETEPGVVWMMFTPDFEGTYGSGLPQGITIAATIHARDQAGNSMTPYTFRFKVDDSGVWTPMQTYSVDPHPALPGDLLTVTLQEGEYAGSRMEYLDTIPVAPFFGKVEEIPQVEGNPTVISFNLQPTMVFEDPVKIYIPLPGEATLQKFKIYHFDANPQIGWQRAEPGDGWLEYREDHEDLDPPTIELWLNHFTGIGVGAETEADSSDSSSAIQCFIATATYGSPDEEHVLIFRKFRDQYLLDNLPGRLIIRTYYFCSPPLADFIARHERLRTISRYMLTPAAAACRYSLSSPKKARLLMNMVLYIIAAWVFLMIYKYSFRKIVRQRLKR